MKKNPHSEMFEHKLREGMAASVEKLAPSAICKQRILQRAHQETTKKGGWTMRNKRGTKIAAMVFACAMLISGGLYAAGHIIGTTSVGSADYQYTDYKEVDQAKAEAGVEAIIPETLGKEYHFDGVRIIKVEDVDESNQKLNPRKELNVTYMKNTHHMVELFAEKGQLLEAETSQYTDKKMIHGVMVYYSAIENLYLPPNEKPTEKEQARADNDPFFNIAYGSPKREEKRSHQVDFEKDGIRYALFVSDDTISKEVLFEMARNIIAG